MAALAGAVAIGITMSRDISLTSVDQETLRQLGCTRRQRVMVAGSSALLISSGGALLAIPLAIALSPLFPLGVARRADPDVGFHADWTVLVLGVVAMAAMLLTIALIAAYRATGRSSVGISVAGYPRKARIAERAAVAGLAPPITNGLRMALESGRGRTAVPVRTAILGAVCGILGVTAVLVFASSLDHLVATPELAGSTWDFKVADNTTNTPCGAGNYGLTQQHGVAALAEVCSQNVQIDGRIVAALAYTTLRGAPIGPEITAGRPPSGLREIALGSKTLHALGKRIGNTVQVTGRTTTLEFRIVGRAVFPTLGQAQPLADGAAFTGAAYAPLFDQNIFVRYFVGRFAPGADRPNIERRIDAIPQLETPSGPTVPVEIDRLRQVNWLPATLAALFGGLALLAVGHALITSVRRRRPELALLKTLGFTRRQVRATVAWQATTIGTVGLAIGIPAGTIVGSLIWRLVVEGLGVSAPTATPSTALLLTIPCVLALSNLIGFLPARAAARTQPAIALRSE
jgi:hypothetical protein